MKSDKEPEIKIITDDEDSLKILGELLSNKTSRDLMKFLMNKSEYKKKISDSTGVPFALVEHHLKKMEKIGLVKITNKQLIKSGVLHKTYKITAEGIFVLLNSKEKVEEKGTIKKIFREGVKFASIGIAFIGSSIISQNHFKVNEINYPIPFGSDIPQSATNSLEFWIYPLMVLVVALIIERIIFGIKKRKGG